MKRVLVVGSSGSGKSVVAGRLAKALGAPHVELDALFWGPEWSSASADELRDRVAAATTGEAWVVDGNYQSKIGTLVIDRADTVVWVNPSRARTIWQVLVRTARRVVFKEVLWSGNRESLRGFMFWRGEQSIVWWAWTSYSRIQDRCLEAMAEPGGPDWHRLRSRRDVDRLLAWVDLAVPG